MNDFDDLTKDPISLSRRNSLPASHRHVPNTALTEPYKSSPCDFSSPNLVTCKTFSLYLVRNDAEFEPLEQTFSNSLKAHTVTVCHSTGHRPGFVGVPVLRSTTKVAQLLRNLFALSSSLHFAHFLRSPRALEQRNNALFTRHHSIFFSPLHNFTRCTSSHPQLTLDYLLTST